MTDVAGLHADGLNMDHATKKELVWCFLTSLNAQVKYLRKIFDIYHPDFTNLVIST